jgi:thioredoxin-related protein
LFFFAPVKISAQGIKFKEQIYSVLEFEKLAKKSKKPSLLIAFSSKCDVCKHMDSAIYKDKTVGKFYNKNYDVYKIDLEQEYSEQFAEKFQIYSYPNYLFFNTNAVLIHRQKGGFPVKEFIELGEDAKNPERQYLSASQKFQSGERSIELCKNLAESSKEMDNIELQRKAVMCYLESNTDWKSKESIKFIYDFVESISEPHFQFLIQNKKLFEDQLGEGKVSEKIDNIILRDIAQASYDEETKKLDTTKARVFAEKYLPRIEINKALALFNANEFIRKNDTLSYINAIIQYFNDFPSKNGYLLTNLSQAMSDLSNDPSILKKALDYSITATKYLQSENCYMNAASIAIRLNNYSIANSILLEGKQYALKENKKYSAINQFIKEINKK